VAQKRLPLMGEDLLSVWPFWLQETDDCLIIEVFPGLVNYDRPVVEAGSVGQITENCMPLCCPLDIQVGMRRILSGVKPAIQLFLCRMCTEQAKGDSYGE
jgi:hypothetical protein